ncbi:MAG: hypothetical protein HYT93_01535 [Parcubacteria group bacterium]|nr:hypothetical protein [Parcubacteria group bacterium]
MRNALYFIIGVIVTIALYAVFEDPINSKTKNFLGKFFADPAIEISVTETKLVENSTINDVNYLFTTQYGYGTLTAIQNVDKNKSGKGIINPDFILCEGSCSAYSIYITNSSPRKAKNIKLEFMNGLIQEGPIELKAEEKILKSAEFNNCVNRKCTLNLTQLGEGDEILLMYLATSNEFSSQCSVGGSNKYCSVVDYINAQAIYVFPDFYNDFTLMIDDIKRPLPPLEKSSDFKCYRLDTKSYIWLPLKCSDPVYSDGIISIEKQGYTSKLESIIGKQI